MTPEDNVLPIEPPAPLSKSFGARCRRFLGSVMSTRLDKSGSRLKLIGVAFIAVFLTIDGKLVMLGVSPDSAPGLKQAAAEALSSARPDILDRNGAIMATDLKTMSVFAEPRRLIDKDEAVELLTAVLPDVDAKELRQRIGSKKGFVWVKRGITPEQQKEVFRLGLPGVGFVPENKRIYPNGPIAAHVLGFTNLDNQGIAGIEKYIDGQGLADLHGAGFNLARSDLKPIQLSIDVKATHAMRDELAAGVAKFKAKSGAAAIMDVNTGEVIAFASLPDYDPNNPVDALDPNHINHLTVGTYEMGSTFKAISIAMALEANKVTLKSTVDARDNLRYGRFTIHDFHATHRVLTVPEVFTHSSNIGTAKMAMMVGVAGHKAFLKKMGQLDRLRTELPENAMPIVPRNWSELNTITIAFGQGLNVAPLQAMMAVAGLANGGMLLTPTFLKQDTDDRRDQGVRVVRPEVSEDSALHHAPQRNGRIGKESQHSRLFRGRQDRHGRQDHPRPLFARTGCSPRSCRSIPADKPKYLFLVLMDDPQAVRGHLRIPYGGLEFRRGLRKYRGTCGAVAWPAPFDRSAQRSVPDWLRGSALA